MSSAAAHRMRRARIPEQGSLDLHVPAALDLATPAAAAHEQADFAVLAADFAHALPRTPDPWADSPYAWIKRLPPARRSATGIALLSRWLTHCGVPHENQPPTADHELVVGGTGDARTVRVRLSTLWSGGDFIFQGLRPGGFDLAALVGIAPQRVHLWVVPAAEALAHVDSAGWIAVNGAHAPAWLAPYGGGLAAGARLLANDELSAKGQGPTLRA